MKFKHKFSGSGYSFPNKSVGLLKRTFNAKNAMHVGII